MCYLLKIWYILSSELDAAGTYFGDNATKRINVKGSACTQRAADNHHVRSRIVFNTSLARSLNFLVVAPAQPPR